MRECESRDVNANMVQPLHAACGELKVGLQDQTLFPRIISEVELDRVRFPCNRGSSYIALFDRYAGFFVQCNLQAAAKLQMALD